MLVKPGTDGALACAVMHCLFRDGKADWDYLDKYTDAPRELEAHLHTRDPAWASAITGMPGRDDRGIRKADRRDQARLSSASATASRARATAPSTCTRRAAFPR